MRTPIITFLQLSSHQRRETAPRSIFTFLSRSAPDRSTKRRAKLTNATPPALWRIGFTILAPIYLIPQISGSLIYSRALSVETLSTFQAGD